jgi:hypothetical protein
LKKAFFYLIQTLNLFQVDCKIIHISYGNDLLNYMNILSKHFREFGSPVMMGGDADAASKCILAVRSNKQLLILVNILN